MVLGLAAREGFRQDRLVLAGFVVATGTSALIGMLIIHTDAPALRGSPSLRLLRDGPRRYGPDSPISTVRRCADQCGRREVDLFRTLAACACAPL